MCLVFSKLDFSKILINSRSRACNDSTVLNVYPEKYNLVGFWLLCA